MRLLVFRGTFTKLSLNLIDSKTWFMHQLITIHPDIQSGTPVFFNTRVPVKNLFDYVKGGHTVTEFIDDFPSVGYEQALAVLDLAESSVMFNSSARA